MAIHYNIFKKKNKKKNTSIINYICFLIYNLFFRLTVFYMYYWFSFTLTVFLVEKKVREKSRECHIHKPLAFPTLRGRVKQTKPTKRKSNKRTESTKISSLFPKRGIRNAKRTEKHKNKDIRSFFHHSIKALNDIVFYG